MTTTKKAHFAADVEAPARPGRRGCEGPGPTFDVYRSETDGVVVVHVDTFGMPENEHGPILRVYINDDTDNPAFANPPLPRR